MVTHSIQFSSTNRGRLSFDEAMREIMSFIKKEPERFYKIIIGTDSRPAHEVSLVTAVTVWRVGNGAIHFWTAADARRFATMRERIWQEAINSITLAQEVRAHLQKELGDNFFWDGNEIHVDIGANGPTKELIDSVTGMIRGYHFEPVIKPFAFGASIVADRHT